jgi:hypothetical protein
MGEKGFDVGRSYNGKFQSQLQSSGRREEEEEEEDCGT